MCVCVCVCVLVCVPLTSACICACALVCVFGIAAGTESHGEITSGLTRRQRDATRLASKMLQDLSNIHTHDSQKQKELYVI